MNLSVKNIFIVDDEPLLLELLTDYLREQFPGHQLHTFSTGESAIESMSLDPDLLILDYYLNSRELSAADGLDILKRVKKTKPNIPVVMLSSQPNYGVAAQTIAHGAIHYVMKGESAFQEVADLVKANI